MLLNQVNKLIICHLICHQSPVIIVYNIQLLQNIIIIIMTSNDVFNDGDVDNILTWKESKSIIEKFLPREWPLVDEDQVTIKKISGGYINSVYLIERHNKCIVEPRQLIIRQSGGGKLIFSEDDENLFKNTFIEESIIFYQASKLFIAPKLYGVYEKGRVEEYVSSHTLKCNDVDDTNIRAQIAHKFASFHSMDLPIRRDKYFDIQNIIIRDMTACQSVEQRVKCIPSYLDKKNINFESLITYDFLTEYNWLDSMVRKINSRTCLLLSDNNYLNVLIRDDGEKKGDEQVVLIDFEAAHYGPRLLDFGGHFVLRTVDWSLPQEDKSTHLDILDDQQRDQWLYEYQRQLFKLNAFPDLDHSTIDSLDHLREEADLGILRQSLVWSFFIFNRLDTFSVDLGFATTALLLLQIYIKYKRVFLTKHTHWNTCGHL